MSKVKLIENVVENVLDFLEEIPLDFIDINEEFYDSIRRIVMSRNLGDFLYGDKVNSYFKKSCESVFDGIIPSKYDENANQRLYFLNTVNNKIYKLHPILQKIKIRDPVGLITISIFKKRWFVAADGNVEVFNDEWMEYFQTIKNTLNKIVLYKIID